MTDRVVVIVQARMGSRRLPGKSLRALAGRPMIVHVIERATAISGVDDVIVATTTDATDDLLAETVLRTGAALWRGSETDVLDRMLMAAETAVADIVVRVTGDCPFLAPEVAASVLALHRQHGCYCWNDTAHSGYPDGTDVEVFPMSLLQLAHRATRRAADREHVTTWMRRQESHPIHTLRSLTDHSRIKLSVDTPEDYIFAQRVHLWLRPGDYSLEATLRAAMDSGEIS